MMGALNGSNGPRAIGYWGSVDGWEESDTASVATAEGGVNGGGAGADNRIPETGCSIVVRAPDIVGNRIPAPDRGCDVMIGAPDEMMSDRTPARPPAQEGGGRVKEVFS